MNVEEIMTREPVTISPRSTVREAAAAMKKNHVGGLPVVEGDQVVGIITDSDVLGLLKTGDLSHDLWLPSPLEIIEVPVREFINWEHTKKALSDIGSTLVGEVMSHPVATIAPGAEIEEAATAMLSKKVNRLPVVENGRLIGIVTRADIVEGIARGE
jgi:CBS domain-containing protein